MKTYHTTFGSEVDNDGYYLEFRDDPADPFAFLTFWVDDDAKLHAAVGKGESAVKLGVEELRTMIEGASKRLSEAKANWDIARRKFDRE
ncbi:hypothetical protein [Lewinella sp. IMCC34183]|uniref:hypothetical protein n=1 Tax=Lewinella sp. IMCC34183 TaxID=2248762 RepID=UPI000E27B547|nr:hypothetical protein [Lewinella sp. IMCC34183]